MKLSIVMPVARVDNFLNATLDSVQNQTYRNFELIIVCGIDIYQEVLNLMETNKYHFIYKIISTPLRGVAFAANLGIASSSAKYIARWDSDDLCDAARLSRQVQELDANPSLGVIGTKVQIIDECDQPNKFQRFKLYSNNDQIRRALKYRQPLLHSSLIFRADILFNNRGYLYGHTSEDHELFIRIARDESVQFKNLSDVTTYYRRHSSQLSDVSNMKNHFYEISGFMFSEFLRTYNLYYLLGMTVNVPLFRKIRYAYRDLLKFFLKRG